MPIPLQFNKSRCLSGFIKGILFSFIWTNVLSSPCPLPYPGPGDHCCSPGLNNGVCSWASYLVIRLHTLTNTSLHYSQLSLLTVQKRKSKTTLLKPLDSIHGKRQKSWIWPMYLAPSASQQILQTPLPPLPHGIFMVRAYCTLIAKTCQSSHLRASISCSLFSILENTHTHISHTIQPSHLPSLFVANYWKIPRLNHSSFQSDPIHCDSFLKETIPPFTIFPVYHGSLLEHHPPHQP